MMTFALSVVLSWTPPTTYTNGAPLDVANYRIERGTCNGVEFGVAEENLLVDGFLTSAEIVSLPSGEHCFRIYARDAGGLESVASNTAKKVILPPPPPPPPIVTVQTVVYDRTRSGGIGRIVGKIALGVNCIGLPVRTWSNGKKFYEVPRSAVKFTRTSRSAMVVGVCR